MKLKLIALGVMLGASVGCMQAMNARKRSNSTTCLSSPDLKLVQKLIKKGDFSLENLKRVKKQLEATTFTGYGFEDSPSQSKGKVDDLQSTMDAYFNEEF